MSTLKVSFSEITAAEALNYVMSVVHKGRISENKFGQGYCFVTTFTDGTRVVADRTKTMDTFYVSRRLAQI